MAKVDVSRRYGTILNASQRHAVKVPHNAGNKKCNDHVAS